MTVVDTGLSGRSQWQHATAPTAKQTRHGFEIRCDDKGDVSLTKGEDRTNAHKAELQRSLCSQVATKTPCSSFFPWLQGQHSTCCNGFEKKELFSRKERERERKKDYRLWTCVIFCINNNSPGYKQAITVSEHIADSLSNAVDFWSSLSMGQIVWLSLIIQGSPGSPTDTRT